MPRRTWKLPPIDTPETSDLTGFLKKSTDLWVGWHAEAAQGTDWELSQAKQKAEAMAKQIQSKQIDLSRFR
jgi:hypothetical protein